MKLTGVCKNNELNDLRCVFLNAGSGHFGAFAEHGSIHQYLQINFTSQIELLQHFQQCTGDGEAPSVVITGSCIGYVPNKNYVGYHVCKSALNCVVKSIRKEDKNSRVNIVNPATIRGGSFFAGSHMKNA